MIISSFKIIKRWLLCCLLFFISACETNHDINLSSESNIDSVELATNEKAFFRAISENKYLVKDGDLILRTGRDFTSEIMRKLSTIDNTFSHCGIASWEHDSLFVYHALGGEWNPDQKIRRDEFRIFCNPYENRGFGIYRYLINEQQRFQLVAQAREYYRDEIKFDMKFDLASDDKMYCSEYVYKIIQKSVGDFVKLKTTTLNNVEFIAIDNLFKNPYCKEIRRIIFHNLKDTTIFVTK